MAAYDVREAAHRAGLTQTRFDEIVASGVAGPSDAGQFTEGDVRRALCVATLMDAGLPLEALAQGISAGTMSLDFLESPEYERLANTSDATFREVADRTGVPIELLMALREATGARAPEPDDFVRENELRAVPYLEGAVGAGMRAISVERHMRVMGDGLRRIAETESDIWYRELIEPLLAQGKGPDDFPETTHDLAGHGDQLLLAILHGRQAHAWLDNVVRGFSGQLAMAGIHEPAQRLPTMCFIDVTGYTRMTAERGDAAAAEVAEQFARTVERTSAKFGGKPVKWLGDGVMVHFEEAQGAILGALEMLPALSAAGLPPAHVGIHSGEMTFSQGDYFGRNVILSARIADFARPGEVLVSSDSLTAAGPIEGVRFDLIGLVELKGVDGPVELHVARRGQ